MLNFQLKGEGKVVVFLHGFMESNAMWNRLMSFQLPYTCVFIELPGHGASENRDNTEVPSISYFTEEVKRVLNHLKVDNFDCVGHSMGGYVALQLKEQLENCQKVILLNSNFWTDSDEKRRDRIRVADIVLKNKNLFIQEAIPNLYGNQLAYQNEIQQLIVEAKQMDAYAISYASLAMSSRKDYSYLLNKFPADFDIIQGELDKIVTIEQMTEKIAGMQIKPKVIKGVGHMAHHEDPEMVVKLMSDFLN